MTRFPTGKVVAPATKGGMHFLARRAVGLFSDGRKPGCEGFIQTGAFYNLKAPYLASAAIPYNSRGRSPQPVRKASAGPGQNPGSPGPKGPAAGSTLTPVRACQPSGIQESTAQVPIPTAPKGAALKDGKRYLRLPYLPVLPDPSAFFPLLS